MSSEVERLRNGIEDYLLWEPGRKGHAAAHRRLAALLHPAESFYACPTCGENVTRYGRRCPQCERNLEEDRLERESGR